MAETLTVLIAEDDLNDEFLLRRAFEKAGLKHRLVLLRTGEEMVAYLAGKAPYEDRQANPLPDLVLLDLQIPRLSGFTVLQWMRNRAGLKMPVLVLTSSKYESDLAEAARLGATEYHVKPDNPNELVEFVRELDRRWNPSARGPVGR